MQLRLTSFAAINAQRDLQPQERADTSRTNTKKGCTRQPFLAGEPRAQPGDQFSPTTVTEMVAVTSVCRATTI